MKAYYTLALALAALALTGCPPLTGGTIEPGYQGPDLKRKFAVSTTGADGVKETFNAIHAHLAADPTAPLVSLGDYVDLESLTVAGDTGHGAEADYGAISITGNSDVTGGKLLRLIVVGINTFQNSNNPGSAAHVVFQFQNVPGKHKMSETASADGGYNATLIPGYLTTNFTAGLTAAGVPMADAAIIWGPIRVAANKGTGADGIITITDKIWLPTEYEMFGVTTSANTTYETSANQAYLNYYATNDSCVKYDGTNTATRYWLASPRSTNNNFCIPTAAGASSSQSATSIFGVAPAFCVK